MPELVWSAVVFGKVYQQPLEKTVNKLIDEVRDLSDKLRHTVILPFTCRFPVGGTRAKLFLKILLPEVLKEDLKDRAAEILELLRSKNRSHVLGKAKTVYRQV